MNTLIKIKSGYIHSLNMVITKYFSVLSINFKILNKFNKKLDHRDHRHRHTAERERERESSTQSTVFHIQYYI